MSGAQLRADGLGNALLDEAKFGFDVVACELARDLLGTLTVTRRRFALPWLRTFNITLPSVNSTATVSLGSLHSSAFGTAISPAFQLCPWSSLKIVAAAPRDRPFDSVASPRRRSTVHAPATIPSGVQFVDKALAAYGRVSLAPGQSKTVTLEVPLRQLQYWTDASGWVTATGNRPVIVGDSERGTQLSTTVDITTG